MAVAALLIPLAACGGGSPPTDPVAVAVRQWVRGGREADVALICSREFQAADVPQRLWRRIGANLDTTGVAKAPPPAVVERDCTGNYSFPGGAWHSHQPATRVARVARVRIGRPVREAGGITRTATAHALVHNRHGYDDWELHLVEYRGRWRIVSGYD